jgi:hypothetical protein
VVTTIASGQGTPEDLTYANGTLYWIASVGITAGLYGVSTGGGTVTALSAHAVYGAVAVDSQNAYYTSDFDQLVKLSLATQAVTVLDPSDTGFKGLVVDATTVYFNDGASIRSVPIAGGGVNTLASANEAGLAMAGNELYWIAGTPSTGTAVWHVSKTGGSATTLATMVPDTPKNNNDSFQFVAADANGVYWPGVTSTVYVEQEPLAGGTPTSLYSTPADPFYPSAIAVDDQNIYWVAHSTSGPTAGSARVMELPKAGGAPILLFLSPAAPVGSNTEYHSIAAANGYVYWTSNACSAPPSSACTGTIMGTPR